MTRFRWRALLVWFVVSLMSAIALTHLTANSIHTNFAPSYNHSSPNTDTAYSDADTERLQQVELPVNYAERYVPYVTVDCSNSRIVRKIYVNPTVLEALQSSDTLPSGTILVMETHAAHRGRDGRLIPTRINNIFVREKRSGWRVRQDSGEWKSAWYSPEGSLVSSNQGSCIGCHARVRDRDYLFTLPALLTTAQTGIKQQQETEFGTSVCQ